MDIVIPSSSSSKFWRFMRQSTLLSDEPLNRGNTLTRLNRTEEALSDYSCAIELKPDYAEARCALGRGLAAVGRYTEARQEIESVLLTSTELSEAYYSLGFVLSAPREFDRERLENALRAYDKAVQLKPDFPDAHRERGYILGRLGSDKEALDAYDKALELKPMFAEALFGKARSLCFLVKKYPESFPAQESYEKVLTLLEKAINIDKSIAGQINRDRSAFQNLQKTPAYRDKLQKLVWKDREPDTGT